MAFSYYASITIDNTKVSGTSNLSNFPVLISGTYDGTGGEPDLRTVANGGEIQNTTTGGASGSLTIPADLEFYSDSGLTTQLAHEIQSYDASTGAIIAWVKIPTLAYDSDTTIYMAYGDSGVSTTQEDLATLWADYEVVFHMNYTGTQYDSSPNGYDMTEAGTPVTASAVFGNGIDFDGSTDYYHRNIANSVNVKGTGDFFNQCWVNFDANNKWMRCGLVGGYDAAPDHFSLMGRIDSKLAVSHDNLTGAVSSTNFSANEWYLYAGSYDQSENSLYLRARALSDSSTLSGTSNTTGQSRISLSDSGWSGGDTPIALGAKRGNGVFPDTDLLDGTMQEVRFANLYRNTDWVDTEFNNQSAPATFYTMGSETAVPAAGGDTPRGCITLMTKFWGI